MRWMGTYRIIDNKTLFEIDPQRDKRGLTALVQGKQDLNNLPRARWKQLIECLQAVSSRSE